MSCSAARVAPAVLAILLAAAPATAALMPSFSLDRCVRNATHIVVATEGETIDGDLEVLESWYGDLKPGDRIHVPTLAAYASPKLRAIATSLFAGTPPSSPRVSGSRMVLFLRRTSGTTPEDSTWTDADRAAWRESFRISAVWVEDGQAFAFEQLVNPADTVLYRIGTEVALRARVESLLEELALLEKSVGRVAPDRARVVEAVTSAEVLRTLLRDERLVSTKVRIVAVFVNQAEPAAWGPELTSLLERELAYWERNAAVLPESREGWWSAVDDHDYLWRDVVRVLADLRYSAACNVIEKLRDLWKGAPRLAAFDFASALATINDGRPAVSRYQGAFDLPRKQGQERTIEALESKLADDLAAERARPPTWRSVLRGAASSAEVNATLAQVLAGAIPIDEPTRLYAGGLVLAAQRGQPLTLGPLLESARERLAPNVRRLAPALAAGSVGSPYDVQEEWRPLRVFRPRDSEAINGIRSALVLESVHALTDETDACAYCAGLFALDLWRFEHDLRRDERRAVEGDSNPAALLTAAIARLGGRPLEEIDRELAILEATIPSFSDGPRRGRLAYECSLRAYREELRGGDGIGREPRPLDHLSPRAFLPDQRDAWIAREWESAEGVLGSFERSPGPRRKWIAKAPPLEGDLMSLSAWEGFMTVEQERALTDRSRLRLMRVFVAARRFRLEHGRWPSTPAEAVGEELASKLHDPLEANPFVLEEGPDGSLTASLSRSTDTGGFERVYRLTALK